MKAVTPHPSDQMNLPTPPLRLHEDRDTPPLIRLDEPSHPTPVRLVTPHPSDCMKTLLPHPSDSHGQMKEAMMPMPPPPLEFLKSR
eukprot:763474-Hanusia_phi.AAC.1